MSDTSKSKNCPKCGAPIPAEAPQGLCPKCLLAQASLATEAGQKAAPREAPPTQQQLAAAFPQLEILELIGQGGMGFVFKARQPKIERLVALKILPQSLAADPAFAERFTREGRVLARLNHPNIVTIHDFGQAKGFFYLLMEFVDGVNLRQAMRAGRFTPDQALAVVPRICEALQFAHNEGILHRDIKPENILLDSKGRVKIADFGIAKLVGEPPADANLTAAGATLGTPHYMAPEQIEHPQDVDQRADIYSLGVVFYEMLTGELPLGKFQPPSEKVRVDVRLDEVVLHALEKEPARRYQQVSQVKTAVDTIASSAAPTKPPMPAQFVTAPAAATTASPDRFWRRFAVVVLALITIPFVIAVLGIVAAIVIPNFVKAKHGAQERARLVQAQIAARRTGTSSNLVFGPVIERVISHPSTGARCFLNLQSGNLLTPPPEIAKLFATDDWMYRYDEDTTEAARMETWVRANGADVVPNSGYSERGLVLLDGVSCASFSESGHEPSGDANWKMTAVELSEFFNDFQKEVGKRLVLPSRADPTMRTGENQLPKSFVFKTREGNVGILQITGFTENPPAVKIHYKLAQSSPSPSVNEQSASDQTQTVSAQLVISPEQYNVAHPEPGRLDWGFKGFVPPGHLASFLFVRWTDGVPAVDPSFSAYYKVGQAGGIDIPFCSLSFYPIPESQVAGMTNSENRRMLAQWGFPDPNGVTNAVQWNVNLGLGFTSSAWRPMPRYHLVEAEIPLKVRSGHQRTFRLVDFDRPEGEANHGQSGVELRIFLEPLTSPPIRMLPNELDRTNYVAGTGLAGTKEEALKAIKEWPIDP